MAQKPVGIADVLETILLAVIWSTMGDKPVTWPTGMGLTGMAASVGLNYIKTEYGFRLEDNERIGYVEVAVTETEAGGETQISVYPASVLSKVFDILDMEVEIGDKHEKELESGAVDR